MSTKARKCLALALSEESLGNEAAAVVAARRVGALVHASGVSLKCMYVECADVVRNSNVWVSVVDGYYDARG